MVKIGRREVRRQDIAVLILGMGIVRPFHPKRQNRFKIVAGCLGEKTKKAPTM
jgi:hypothetical protein